MSSAHTNSSTTCSNSRDNLVELYYLYFCVWMVLGMGTLFPYNVLISCGDYFGSLYGANSHVEGKIAAACTVSLLLVTILLMPFIIGRESESESIDDGIRHHYSSDNKKKNGACSRFYRVLRISRERALLGYALIVGALGLFTVIPSPSLQFTMNLSYLVGAADAIIQSGLYMLAASVHARATAALSLGSGVAGFVVNILRLLLSVLDNTTATINDDIGRNEDEVLFQRTQAFFLISTSFIVFCLYLVWRYSRLDAINCMKSTFDNLDNSRTSQSDHFKRGSFQIESLGTTSAFNENDINAMKTAADISNSSLSYLQGAVPGYSTFQEKPCSDFKIDSTETDSISTIYRQTLFLVQKPAILLFFSFFITLSLFPGKISEIQASSIHWKDNQPRFSILLITAFNAFDLVGRLIPTYLSYAPLTRMGYPVVDHKTGIPLGYDLYGIDLHITFPIIVRTVCFPLLFSSQAVGVISSDIFKFCLVALFGLTNGYIAVLCFMFTPTMSISNRHRDASSVLLLLACYCGLVAGSQFGVYLDK